MKVFVIHEADNGGEHFTPAVRFSLSSAVVELKSRINAETENGNLSSLEASEMLAWADSMPEPEDGFFPRNEIDFGDGGHTLFIDYVELEP